MSLEMGDIVRHRFSTYRGFLLVGIVEPKDRRGICHVRVPLDLKHEDYSYRGFDEMEERWELLC